jgi:deazaflavin-dependent oxidoreductase (nitroreductase family)
MAKAYQMTPRQRRFNAIRVALLRRGFPLGPFYLLTVQGRKTGQLYRLPVTPIRHDDEWWVISPYGEVSWVRNARAAGRVMLTRGRTQRTFQLHELASVESAPILREYLMRFAIRASLFCRRPSGVAGSAQRRGSSSSHFPAHRALMVENPSANSATAL